MSSDSHRVLVIEDDTETAEQLADFLRTSGYEVDVAVNGEEGLNRGRAFNFTVMTIDRMLPGVDGIEIIRRLREEGVFTPALIISALAEVDDRVREYLARPRQNVNPRLLDQPGNRVGRATIPGDENRRLRTTAYRE